MQRIADRLVELHYLEAISGESVRLVLKKTAQALAEKAPAHRPVRR